MLEKKEKLRVVKQSTVSSNSDTDTVDVLRLASKVGYSLAGDIGAEAFIELELAYATRLLPNFIDDSIIRVNQNVLLYWQYAYYKSTILEVFSRTIPEIFRVADITSMTLEKIFGSIDERRKHIIDPTFTNDIHFVTISELTSLIGQREAMKQFTNVMNIVLEGKRVTRQILKLAYGEISEEELKEHEVKGVFYDPVKGELSYQPNVCIWAATRPLDNHTFTYLNKSGYFSRFHVIQRHITAKEASQHLHKNYRLDQKTLSQLTEINMRLSKIKVAKMLRPSESLMKPIYDNLEALVKDEVKEKPNLKFAEVVNPRLKDDVVRELVAHTFLRTASQNGFQAIGELKYTQEDVDFILERLYHFIEFAVNPIIVAGYSRLTRGSKRDKVKTSILAYLSDGAERHIDEIMKVIESLKVSQATVYNALKEMMKEGRITSTRFGYYRIVKKEGSS